MVVQGVSLHNHHQQQYGRAGCIISTASSMEVQGVYISTASSIDVQGVLISIAKSMEMQDQGVQYTFPPPAV
jgi:uncharacterized protein YwlG (UPF0340 family)